MKKGEGGAKQKEGARGSSSPGQPREIIFSANQGTFIQYPRQHLASNGSATKCLYGVSENVPQEGGDDGGSSEDDVASKLHLSLSFN